MADLIKLLPEVTANQIAAGEVVQRPASVVKELMENAIDAGASQVTLSIENAGKKLIQVSDDGCGMSETDARMALEKHATSKITELEDLFKIHTLGFRGEALASIAAVAHLTLTTRSVEDEAGTKIISEGGEVKSQEPEACPHGTTISVKNLFYNVPARRNFLKSNAAEMRHILDAFSQIALANPGLTFKFYDEGHQTFLLPPENLKRRIISLFGKKYEKALVPVEESASILNVRGFVGSQNVARKKRGEQFFFLNKRFIKNPYLNHAVMTAFKEILPEGYFPFYCLFLETDPSNIDVNVHPTKTEVKFEDERSFYAILKTVIQQSLSQNHIAPSIDFNKDRQWEQYLEKDPEAHSSKSKIGISHNPSSLKSGGGDFKATSQNKKQSEEDWASFYRILSEETGSSDSSKQGEQSTLDESGESSGKEVFQLHDKYILSPIRSGFILVHRYKALERILFEKYTKYLKEQKKGSQQQLFPEVIHFDPSGSKLFEQILPSLQKLGFDVEAFGQNAWLVKGLPAEITVESVSSFFDEMVEAYRHHQNLGDIDATEKVAKSLAGIASVRQKDHLKTEEMSVLIDRLFGCQQPYYAPGGAPTFITIALDELDKKFANK